MELRRTATGLAQVAVRDHLTGLHNRTLLRDALDRAFARWERSLTEPGLIYVDLDAFKPVNDTHGHAAGDQVLRDLAQRLQQCVRATDVVMRLGGDEFVVLVEEVPDLDNAESAVEQIATRIRESVTAPFVLPGGEVLSLTASVGWALADATTDTPDLLLERADAAMYAEKVHARAR